MTTHAGAPLAFGRHGVVRPQALFALKQFSAVQARSIEN